ncbi:hypothetical protein H6802_04420 [Candidatus Nomurabacteria bacterium]|uniref:Uncharacterized protein n=1 Tax=candidate division WWE3 bacterium TaxID=2053526 RepID=A0A955DZU1_UNCKA|nr:hypothetical protein [candidate division WWE3 bacterium]MCB9824164.1 hypothetical protein [Candidatus Nomurabacteria bacterium]MCB9826865.1 hypothetical protein [Candidatus Nomurabacteria bacterium]MCB9828105.1 hypothetical protein [Candidatus Nomurabacteria bacterium]HXK52451.1 hypothetical protein [bacterium]
MDFLWPITFIASFSVISLIETEFYTLFGLKKVDIAEVVVGALATALYFISLSLMRHSSFTVSILVLIIGWTVGNIVLSTIFLYVMGSINHDSKVFYEVIFWIVLMIAAIVRMNLILGE